MSASKLRVGGQRLSFAIEVGVPLLPSSTGKKALYPFADMNVGDSFVFPLKNRGNVDTAASRYKRGHSEWNYTTRLVPPEKTHCRFWRIA